MLSTSPILDSYSMEPKEYFNNSNTYTFQKIIFLDDSFRFELKIEEDLNLIKEGIPEELDFTNKYILFEEIHLVKENYWDSDKRMEFLFNLVELLDIKDKFQLLREIHRHNGPYIIKVRYSLRNIGIHPIFDSNLTALNSYNGDLNLADVLKYYD